MSYEFPRGSGPFVSVLLPTRGRPKLLCGAIDSLLSMCLNQDRIEILVKVDEDDKDTITVLERFSKYCNLTYFVSPRGNGYKDIHLWLADLARRSRGDWLFVWNDDARILTPGWDEILSSIKVPNLTDELFAFTCMVACKPLATEFWFMRRKVFEILGHMGPVPHADSWFVSIMTLLDRVAHGYFQVFHFNDFMVDSTGMDRKIICDESCFEMRSPEFIKKKLEDVNKLLTYIESPDA